MKARSSFWWIGLCALTLSLSTAAIGCGDDDDTGSGGSGGGGTGGSGGKAGATAGKSGSGGTAGKAGGGAGSSSVTPAMCKTATTDLMKDQAGSLPAACVSCICDENAKAVTDCNNNAMCWPLLQCVAEMCTDPSMQTACAQAKCGDKLTGAGPATTLGGVIQGAKCAAKCGAGDTGDAGMNDAGL